MALIADGLLIAAALAAALYCHILAGRLRRLRDMDGGVGAAIAALSSQVEEMRGALKAARIASGEAGRTLGETTARAEMAAGRLELLLAAVHDRDGARPVDVAERRAAARARAAAAVAARARADGGEVADGAGPSAPRRPSDPNSELEDLAAPSEGGEAASLRAALTALGQENCG